MAKTKQAVQTVQTVQAISSTGPEPHTGRYEVMAVQNQLITPTEAKKILEASQADFQRPLTPGRVQGYAENILTGRWSGSDSLIIIATCEEFVGKDYLMAGQHRLSGVVLAKMPIHAIVEYRLYQTKEAIVYDYYAATNAGMPARLNQAIVGMGLDEELGVSKRLVEQIAAALYLVSSNFVSGSRSKNVALSNRVVMVKILRHWKPVISQIGQDFKPYATQVTRRFLRSPVMGVMLITYKHQPDKARQFWSAAFANDALPAVSPQARLIRFLFENTSDSMTGADYACRVARCWNAYYDNRTLTTLRGMMVGQKYIEIDGTPFKGEVIDGLNYIGLDEIGE